MSQTLGEDLQDVVDTVREIPGDLGLWTREVEAIERTWSGEHVGDGRKSEVTEDLRFTITPRPKVRDAQLRRSHEAAGLVTEGSLFVMRISATYTEAEMRGIFDDPKAEQVWRVVRVDGQGNRFPEGVAPVDAEEEAALFRAVWVWRRDDPSGWEMLLNPINE